MNIYYLFIHTSFIKYILEFLFSFFKQLTYLSIYLDVITCVGFSDKYLATGSWDKTVNLIDIQSKTIYHKFEKIHNGNIYIYIYNDVNSVYIY